MAAYTGYELKRTEYINDISSHVFHFEHEKLKTPVVAIKNDDSNKTFCISFRTIPNDSSGAAHILEHTVLSGSRKFPLKEVFNELTRGGLTTFLNAMTGPDTTFYPFATRNLMEYFNIMDVYLDTTLYPRLDKNAFMQEGWRHELKEKNADIELKGVVYNEMKGVYSNPLSQTWYNLFEQLMPESTYAHVSGGDPDNIPDLSWEGLKEFHQRHYHPSNAMVTFYGNAPLEQELEFLDEHYLKSFRYKKPTSRINFGRTDPELKSVETTYSVNTGDEINEKTFITLGIPVSTADKAMENLALKILGELLHSSEASPLKLAFHKANIGKDIEGGLIDHIHTSIMMTEVIGSEKEKKDEFLKMYRNVMEQIVRDGFDKELLLSELNGYEFQKWEEQFNSQRGLSLAQTVISAEKLKTDLFEGLRYSSQFKQIQEKILNENYLENLIKNKLINPSRGVCLILMPESGKNERELKELSFKLAKNKSGMNDDQVCAIVESTSAFKKFQEKENTEEEINSLPRISKSDLPAEPEIFMSEETTICGSVPYFRNEISTSCITTVNIGFDTSCIPVHLLPYLELFGNILTEIGTKDLDYIQFSIKKDQVMGGFSHKMTLYNQFKNRDSYRPVFWLNMKMLEKYIGDSIQLVGQVITDVSFENENRIHEILERNFAWMENYVQSEGYNLPVQRIQSYIHESGWYMEQVSGLTAYQKIKHLLNNYNNEKVHLLKILEEIKQLLFSSSNMIISITGSGKNLVHSETECGKLIEKLPQYKNPVQKITIPELKMNEALATSSEVIFAVQGGDMNKSGLNYNGSFEVLKTWLSRGFLHKRVRAAGGAYGCFSLVDPLLGFNCYVSYRDPNLESTFKAYEEIPEVVSSLEISDRDLEQLIIRTFGNYDPLLNPFAKAVRGRNQALSSIPKNYLIQFGDEIRNTTVNQMKGYADVLADFFNQSYKTVIGNKEKIMSSSHLFDSIIEI